MDVLVLDVGGTTVKMLATDADGPRQFESGADMTPEAMVDEVHRATADWHYDVISLGYPGTVDGDRIRAEPGNLAEGWVGFDFERTFGKPVRIVNDAVMQALGGYDGGRMLYLGLGTGLGTTLVTEHVVIPLELGCLPYTSKETMAERLGVNGLETHGLEEWRRSLARITAMLRESFSADYIVLGGGNVTHVAALPPQTRRGGNDDAFSGGFRLWEEMVEPHDRKAPPVWRVVR
jgi:polyphosphate glucokinase